MMNTKTDTQGSSSPLSNMNELLDEWLQVQSNNMKLESDDIFCNVSNDRTTPLYECIYYNAVGRRCNFSASKRVASKRRKIYNRLKELDWQSLGIFLILYLNGKKLAQCKTQIDWIFLCENQCQFQIMVDNIN